MYGCFVVLLCVFRLCGVQQEMWVMSVCLMLSWSNLMFFGRGFAMLGPYVIVLQKVGGEELRVQVCPGSASEFHLWFLQMVFRDLVTFMCLIMIVLIGFASGENKA